MNAESQLTTSNTDGPKWICMVSTGNPKGFPSHLLLFFLWKKWWSQLLLRFFISLVTMKRRSSELAKLTFVEVSPKATNHELVGNSLSHWVLSPTMLGYLGAKRKGAVGFTQGWNTHQIPVTRSQGSKGIQRVLLKLWIMENKQDQKWRKKKPRNREEVEKSVAERCWKVGKKPQWDSSGLQTLLFPGILIHTQANSASALNREGGNWWMRK